MDKLALLPMGDHYRGRISVWTVAASEQNRLSPLSHQEHEIVVPANKRERLGTLTIDLVVEVPEGELGAEVAPARVAALFDERNSLACLLDVGLVRVRQ